MQHSMFRKRIDFFKFHFYAYIYWWSNSLLACVNVVQNKADVQGHRKINNTIWFAPSVSISPAWWAALLFEWRKWYWIQLIYWQFCQTATRWNNNAAAKYCRETWRGEQGLPGGLPERCAGMPPRWGSGAFFLPVKNELLFTRFSFHREKLSVARLQREVAQSKSEGAMVSCGNSLLCDSCLTTSGLRCVMSCWRRSPEH